MTKEQTTVLIDFLQTFDYNLDLMRKWLCQSI